MLSRTIHGEENLSGGYVILDVGLYEHLTIQVIGLEGACNIEGSNDGGAITGSVIDTPRNAENFTAIQAVNLTTGATATTVTGTNLFRISPVAFRYLRLGDGASFSGTKILIHGTTVV